jgi:hypothetical protein
MIPLFRSAKKKIYKYAIEDCGAITQIASRRFRITLLIRHGIWEIAIPVSRDYNVYDSVYYREWL